MAQLTIDLPESIPAEEARSDTGIGLMIGRNRTYDPVAGGFTGRVQ